MKLSLIATACCFFCASLFGDAVVWSTAEISLAPSSSTGANVDTMVAMGPNAGNVVATWGDSSTYAPYYSIYSNGVWSTNAIPLTVSGGTDSQGVYNNIYAALGPNVGNLIATWSDYNAEVPYFSLYDGSSWTTGVISLNGSAGSYNDVVVATGPNPGEVMSAWTNLGSHVPYYSIYSGGTWTTGTIPLNGSAGSSNDVFVAPGPTPGTMVAGWSDRSSQLPYYSIYSGGTWTTGPIPVPSDLMNLFGDVVVANGPEEGQVAASFVGITTMSTMNIYVSIYEGGSWTTMIIPPGTSIGGDHNVYLAAEITGEMVATWGNLMTKQPYYSIYQNGVWSEAAEIPLDGSMGDHLDVAVARLLDTNTMVATWNDIFFPGQPFYSTFVGSPLPVPPPPPISSLLPPTNGQGAHATDRFALLVTWSNNLQWTASISNGVVGYNIRRNGTLIATNVTQTSYTDSNRPKKGTDVYTISSVDANGTESLAALEIVVMN